MAFYLILLLAFRVACYLGVGALFYIVLIGNHFDWGSMVMWAFLLAWPVMVSFAIFSAIGAIGIVIAVVVILVFLFLGFRDKLRARRRRRAFKAGLSGAARK